MDYENFKEQIVKDLEDYFHSKGENVSVTATRTDKLNESYDALIVKPEESNIGVNLRLTPMYEAYNSGAEYSEVMRNAIATLDDALGKSEQFNISGLRNYEEMKSSLVMEVVSAEANADFLQTVPHHTIEDMAVVYRFLVDEVSDGRASVVVSNNMLATYGVSEEQLRADALANAPEIRPAVIKGMGEVLSDMMGVEMDELVMMGMVTPEMNENMLVATVQDNIHGASVIAYQDFMDQAAERAGGDFFILPSSIHEVLIIPDRGETDSKQLETIVRQVNNDEVKPEDKLSDNVYHYDSKEKVFELADKYMERQAEKEEKGSVLGEIKAKKGEIAKQPKKDVVEKAAKEKGGEAI
jgi:hypothetical protein